MLYNAVTGVLRQSSPATPVEGGVGVRSYRYVIVGGGMAAAAAVEGIRRHDREHRIALLSAERFPPYARPPLSKGLWKGERLEGIWRYRDPEALGIDEYLGTRAVRLDRGARVVEDQFGRRFGYDKLLLATGGSPRRLAGDPPGVIYFRTLDDYLRLEHAVADGPRTVLVVGGGFIGAEVAAALHLRGHSVTMVVPEAGLLARLLPDDLARAVADDYRSRGLAVLTNETLTRLEGDPTKGYTAVTAGGREIAADLVVAGLGIRPETGLAEAAGLDVDDGVTVDTHGRTTDPAVWAAGDVARFPVAELGWAMRVEHEDNAVAGGTAVGENMAGQDATLESLPLFYSDLFDHGFEAVGRVDATLPTVADWVEPYRQGVVYYVHAGRVVGVLNWNVWDGVTQARQIIRARTDATEPERLIGRIRPA